MTCSHCENLSDLEREYPDEPHHGAQLICDECDAEYYEEYSGKIWATNEQALTSHPLLKML